MSSIKIRLKREQEGEVTRVRALIRHPMETGRRINSATGKPVPANFIQQVIFEHNGAAIATFQLGAGISKNPYLAMKFSGGVTGDRVTVRWSDNLGRSDSAEATIPSQT